MRMGPAVGCTVSRYKVSQKGNFGTLCTRILMKQFCQRDLIFVCKFSERGMDIYMQLTLYLIETSLPHYVYIFYTQIYLRSTFFLNEYVYKYLQSTYLYMGLYFKIYPNYARYPRLAWQWNVRIFRGMLPSFLGFFQPSVKYTKYAENSGPLLYTRSN